LLVAVFIFLNKKQASVSRLFPWLYMVKAIIAHARYSSQQMPGLLRLSMMERRWNLV
jgi:hypothetical protein